MIGFQYYYPSDPNRKIFVVKVVRKFTIHFECGHWCTDNVFRDLKCVKGDQLKLF